LVDDGQFGRRHRQHRRRNLGVDGLVDPGDRERHRIPAGCHLHAERSQTVRSPERVAYDQPARGKVQDAGVAHLHHRLRIRTVRMREAIADTRPEQGSQIWYLKGHLVVNGRSR
jgi:hypothetical protein